MNQNITRRFLMYRGLHLLSLGTVATALGACSGRSGGSADAESATACADPAASDSNARAGLAYVEKSPDPQSVCAGCVFFHPQESGGHCGTCDIFSGGAVNSAGHCRSWTAKAATSGSAKV